MPGKISRNLIWKLWSISSEKLFQLSELCLSRNWIIAGVSVFLFQTRREFDAVVPGDCVWKRRIHIISRRPVNVTKHCAISPSHLREHDQSNCEAVSLSGWWLSHLPVNHKANRIGFRSNPSILPVMQLQIDFAFPLDVWTNSSDMDGWLKLFTRELERICRKRELFQAWFCRTMGDQEISHLRRCSFENFPLN